MAKEESSDEKKQDLGKRTARFAQAITAFAGRVPVNPVTRPLIRQLVDAGTSIDANYGAAEDPESGRDFRHKIGVVKKEARETKYWLRMIASAEPTMKPDARPLWQEAKELHLIFARIFRSSKQGD